jgi:cobyrinic acid a,c-diamide synthase
MSRLPRLAVGTLEQQTDGTPMLWALMDALERDGLRIQSFLARACFCRHDGATAITGQPPRHLDTWLMDEPLCRDIFVRGSRAADLSLVEGCFAQGGACNEPSGGDLATLCQWLDLPRLVIIDAAALDKCQLPARPEGAAGVLLDRVADATEAARLQTHFESLWNVPVIGWLGLLPELRKLIDATPFGHQPSLGLCHTLGRELSRSAQLDRIYRIAKSRKFPAHRAPERRSHAERPVRVAVAYDDAFHCYFADALDLLELKGAIICDFSPLRDDRLPVASDVVYFGCGFPDLHARQLADNDCMILSLKSHLSSGGRIYAEGGGLAYLCQQIKLPDGQSWPMVGAVSAIACLNSEASPPSPVELTMVRDTWLGPPPLRWAGYLNQRWSIARAAGEARGSLGAANETDMIGAHQAIGSRLHMNFAAREELLDRFFEPHRGSSGEHV